MVALRKKMQFGSDYPLIRPDVWMDGAKEVGFRDDVLPDIMKDNPAKLLGLA